MVRKGVQLRAWGLWGFLVLWAGVCHGDWLDSLLDCMKPPTMLELETTGYCNCGQCCSWERSWHGFGHPVHSVGRLRGRRKEIGVTASGRRARIGTVAADTTVLPLGTLVFVPGFGWGRVEDRGGAIKGNKLDLWFEEHAMARDWGRKKKKVAVWRPSGRP